MYKLIATTIFEKIEEENKPKVEQALKYFSVIPFKDRKYEGQVY